MSEEAPASELYFEAFAVATGANLLTDETFQVVDANSDCLDMLDVDREALLGTTPERVFADEELFENATDRLEAGNEWNGECTLLTAEDRRLQVEASAAPLSVEGERRGAVFGFVDLTDRQNRQESLRVLNRVLRHNLRNDANVVLGHLETAADIATDERVEESIAVAQRRMEGSLDRARTAREFSRHLAADEEPNLYPVDLAGALSQAINKVDSEVAEVIIDVPQGTLVRADETVTAALRNVVENAVVHTGPEPTIVIDAEAGDGMVTLRVGDDGPGIPSERRSLVLERGGSAVRHGEGLGLFFVDRLLSVYGGELTIGQSDMGGCLVELEFRRASMDGVEFVE